MCPVCGVQLQAGGRLSAENFIGRSPVAGIVNRNGEPGRTPKTLAPLMRGVAGAAGVRMYGATGAGCGSPLAAKVVAEAGFKFRIHPVRVVEVNAVAGIAHLEHQLISRRPDPPAQSLAGSPACITPLCQTPCRRR